MKIYVDSTEPGILLQIIAQRSLGTGIEVERTMLHKREGIGGSLRREHPLYGRGADHIITADDGLPVVAVERKALEDLAKSATLKDPSEKEQRIFRQLKDLAALPTPILLLEGRPSLLYRQVESALLGLQFWCAREGIAIMYSSGPRASANAVFLMARKLRPEASPPSP